MRSTRPEAPRARAGLSPSDIEAIAKRHNQQIPDRDDDEAPSDDSRSDLTEIIPEEHGWSKDDPEAVWAAQ